MINLFFEDEEIKEDDLYFMCYMIEKVARTLHVRNKEVVNAIGYDELVKQISLANVLHCENPLKVVNDWIEEFKLQRICAESPLSLGVGWIALLKYTIRHGYCSTI